MSPSAHRWPVVPPATIGMLGGGQLGRYALMAARRMGYGTMVLDPDPGAPAGAIADEHLIAPYDDIEALDRMAELCAVVTVEFENPPAESLARLAELTTVAPDARAVAIAQDRRREKGFLRDAGLPVAPFAVVDTATDVETVAAAIGYPAVLKTASGGYDGKGQWTADNAAALASAWEVLGDVPCVLEQRLELDCEICAIIARSRNGDMVAYPVAENRHTDGILRLTVVPAGVDVGVAETAIHHAIEIASRLEYVGVLAVEFFVVNGDVMVNELAPRPHNSGHWTLDASMTDQFAQQVRAVCGLPLGSTEMTAPAAAMANLLGDLWSHGEPDWAAALADAAVSLHLYGKSQARPGRKMGHLTALSNHRHDALDRVTAARARAAPSPNARSGA